MIVKCMRPQNPNFSEEKMGLISAKKSIKTMVPYNGPALVDSSVLVGRTFKQKPVLKMSGFFYHFPTTNLPFLLTFPKPEKSRNFGKKWQSFGHYNFAIFSTTIYIFRSKSMSQ